MPKASRREVPLGEDTLALLDALAASAPSPSPSGPRPAPDEDPGPGVPTPDQNPSQPPEQPEPDEPGEETEDGENGEGEPDEDPDEEDPQRARLVEYQENFVHIPETALEGEVTPPPRPDPSAIRYESRITILEAWQYPGNLARAPSWVDRNWTAYSTETDPIRDISPGPCLKIPLPYSPSGERVLCRVGDYVALQSVRIENGISDTRIEVWARMQFQKLFMPQAS